MEIERVIDPDGRSDVLNEVTAAATVVSAALSKDGVSACGEAVEVEVPQFVLIQFYFVQIVRTQSGLEVVDHALLHHVEFHKFILLLKYKFGSL
jgi:hypothetical protein